MKKLFFLGLCSLLVFSTHAQQSKLIATPPNCVAIEGDYLFMSTTEVTNMNWREFLFDTRQSGDVEAFKAALLDTLVWHTRLGYGEPFVEYYHTHPAYRNYPAVGMTQAQATAYCDWLTKKLNTLYATRDEAVTELRVRLPTKAEWEQAAKGKQGELALYPWEGTSLRCDQKKYAGQFRANFKRGKGDLIPAGRLSDYADITAPVYSYWPNDMGLYNMSGNVAEWVAEPGETKGGSWRTTAYYLRIDADDDRENTGKATSDIGFRYVVEVVKLKDDLPRKKDLKLTAKFVESSTVYVLDSLYAATTEVPNRLYAAFLEDLSAEDFEKHAPNDALWASATPYSIYQSHSKLPRWDNHPVVNISHESAEAFCAWLTAQYNTMEKRKFKQVRFRLPTNVEWDHMARGGLNFCVYPWGGPYARNSRGCYLANFNPQEIRFQKQDSTGTVYYAYPNDDISISRELDGGEFTLPVYSYHPNDYGLYNCSGNAAEMVQEKGISKGGSWASKVHQLEIAAHETYEGPSPTLGFRYVMEVIEE